MTFPVADDFKNPGSRFRGKPFWAWNGKLEPDELRRQIRLMHRMGLGGFFMHSRVGLGTAYLSEDWFKCVDACVDEAKKLGMEAWMYDEDRWPSGAAGGLVTKNPAYRMRSLVVEIHDSPKTVPSGKDVVAVFTATVDGDKATGVARVPKSKKPAPKKGERIISFRVQVQATSSWYNGYTYLDTMDHDAVKKFIEVTHEVYRKNVGSEFAKTIPGIFTDEPNYGHLSPDGHVLPWTRKLLQTFRKRYGYDLADRLPELYFDVDGQTVSQARYHYFDCITFLFVDAFARQVGEWCDKNNVMHTGHVLGEETLSSQTGVVGDSMRFYEYMQAPGMDILTEYNREYDTAKQVTSVARQFDRKWRLTETYGCTGWDFPFAGHKAIGDWQVAFGINLRAQHLSWYTMEGQAKRDYPAAIFYQSPWWEMYPKVEDYFARVHAVMTKGREVRDVLVVHPIESMWTLVKRDWKSHPETAAWDRKFISLRDTLLKANLDFDYGSEAIMQRHARVTRKSGKAILRIGKASYTTVVVPPMITMRKSTLALLESFRNAGGAVVFAGKPAGHVDAQPCHDVARLAKTCVTAPENGKKLADAVAQSTRRVSITDPAGNQIPATLYLLREDNRAKYLFITNTGYTERKLLPEKYTAVRVRDRLAAFDDVTVTAFSQCDGAPVELDPDTGEIFSADAVKTADGWKITTSLPALGSRIFVSEKSAAKRAPALPARPKQTDVSRKPLTGKTWDIRLSEANCLVFDYPEIKIGNGKWKKAMEVLRADNAVRDAMGIPRRGGQMVQPWARKINANPKRTRVTLRYTFDVKTPPSGDVFLAIERPETFTVTVNGSDIDTDSVSGWWVDASLKKIPVDPNLFRTGKNDIVLECDYSENHPGLEIIYLLGRFGTRAKGRAVTMTAAPTSLKIGDWVRQGLTFYSGSVTYEKTISPKLKKGERLIVRVPDYRGVGVRILIDGKQAGIIAWEPNEVDVTDYLKASGSCRLQIEVLGHRRNSHGPLHLSQKWPTWTGPGQFTTDGDAWVEHYQLVPCGLMAAPELVTRR